MESSQFDLPALRQAHESLSRRIAWIAFLRLVVLFALVLGLYIGFASALRRLDLADLKVTENERQILSTNLGKDPSSKTPEETKALQGALLENQSHVSEIYDRAFVSHLFPERGLPFAPDELDWLLHTQITFDVRHWPAAVPPLLILITLSQVYLHILRKKRQLLEHVQRHAIEVTTPADFTFDRLCLVRHSDTADPFARHPAQFVKWLNFFAWLGLLTCLFPLLAFLSWTVDALWLSSLAAAVALYAIVYGRYVSGRLEHQTEAILGRQLAPTWVVRSWNMGTRWAQSLMARLKPRWSLGIGSVLLLMTLFLATSTDGCHDYRGYEIVLGSRGRWWSAAFFDSTWWFTFAWNWVTRGVYVLSLSLAVLAIVLVLAAVRRPKVLQNRRWLAVLSAFSGAVSLFAIGDLAAFPLLGLILTTAPWTLGWLVPLGLWLRFGFSQERAVRDRWLRIRPALVALLLPLVVFDIVTLYTAIAEKIYGLVAFYFGAHFLALGFLKLAAETRLIGPPGASKDALGSEIGNLSGG